MDGDPGVTHDDIPEGKKKQKHYLQFDNCSDPQQRLKKLQYETKG